MVRWFGAATGGCCRACTSLLGQQARVRAACGTSGGGRQRTHSAWIPAPTVYPPTPLSCTAPPGQVGPRCALTHGVVCTHLCIPAVVLQLLYLDSADPKRDITLYINSPGGSVTAGATGLVARGTPQEATWHSGWGRLWWERAGGAAAVAVRDGRCGGVGCGGRGRGGGGSSGRWPVAAAAVRAGVVGQGRRGSSRRWPVAAAAMRAGMVGEGQPTAAAAAAVEAEAAPAGGFVGVRRPTGATQQRRWASTLACGRPVLTRALPWRAAPHQSCLRDIN